MSRVFDRFRVWMVSGSDEYLHPWERAVLFVVSIAFAVATFCLVSDPPTIEVAESCDGGETCKATDVWKPEYLAIFLAASSIGSMLLSVFGVRIHKVQAGGYGAEGKATIENPDPLPQEKMPLRPKPGVETEGVVDGKVGKGDRATDAWQVLPEWTKSLVEQWVEERSDISRSAPTAIASAWKKKGRGNHTWHVIAQNDGGEFVGTRVSRGKGGFAVKDYAEDHEN